MKRLILMTGSIACAKATSLISEWVKQGDEVKVVCSPGALNFVGLATLEGLSQQKVMSTTYEVGAMMDHIRVSRWADQIILCPATANVINKLAAGIADDVVTTVWIAAYSHAQETGKPMWLVPAMNTMMWQYPATQSAINKLSAWGIKVMMPNAGSLACGESGEGRMPEVADIMKQVEQL
ncbi:flavoprotein [Marinicella litoralis]|uniref:Phosphopantothenoylcysteine decarboxylase/phosphopantothenate--cysteine ligase n=1 Tax=Marinicella litoralis TaxID=644220 RepID=A0A4R6XSC8_9GAMM|nr:flavoprotein [Marinicella litoralis]TDR20857.1 phosphopantothenoylcysteine decarboxylase/phosphopantothenate--cysteine ligase [Marinicella litoralis]